MHIGLVGPAAFLTSAFHSLQREFPQIQITPFPYTDLSELPGRLEGEQYQCDFFLFLGETARRWTASQLKPVVPWYSVPRSTSSLLRILVQAFKHSTPPELLRISRIPTFFSMPLKRPIFRLLRVMWNLFLPVPLQQKDIWKKTQCLWKRRSGAAVLLSARQFSA